VPTTPPLQGHRLILPQLLCHCGPWPSW